MADYVVVKPTTVMPEATGPSYAEGDNFELDMRKPENEKYIAELGDVVAEADSLTAKAFLAQKKAEAEQAEAEEAKALVGLEEEDITDKLAERNPNGDAAEKKAEAKAKKAAATAKKNAEAKAKKEAEAKAKKAKAAADAKTKAEAKEETPNPNEDEGE